MKRKLLVLALTLLLVVSMAVPAFAATFTGTYKNKQYTFTIYDYSSSATGTFSYNVDTNVKIYIKMTTWCSQHQDQNLTDFASGSGAHGSATANVDCIIDGHHCFTSSGVYTGYVDGTYAASVTY